MESLIFDITRCSLNDGPGIRTVIYFKGCSMHCRWCHNPEGISPEPQVLFYSTKCIGCGRCVRACPDNHQVIDGIMQFVREGCEVCEECVQACPNEALQLCGKRWSTDALMTEIEKDMGYYTRSGGGVTFSGGECLLHSDQVAELLSRCKAKGIHTAVESAGNVPWEAFEKVYTNVDLFLLDIKHADSEVHRELTGTGNEQIFANIRKLSEMHSHIWIRIPLIPNANDSDENLRKIGRLIHEFGTGIQRVELLKYNNMASNKYAALGRQMESFADQTQTDEVMTEKCRVMREAMDREEIPVTFA